MRLFPDNSAEDILLFLEYEVSKNPEVLFAINRIMLQGAE